MSGGIRPQRALSSDDNCKPIEKYGSLGLFRAHEVPEIEAIVIDKPGLNVACGFISIKERSLLSLQLLLLQTLTIAVTENAATVFQFREHLMKGDSNHGC